jgi:DNA-binding FrmR family transcriptional regulator
MKENVRQDGKRRLARISGQVNGLQKMLDEERYCVDILTQVSALRAALDQFGVLMLSMHLEDCVYGDQKDGHADYKALSPDQRIDEIKVTLNRFLK